MGKVVRGSIVKLLDEHGKEVPLGETGRIFVGNISQFEGYTGGGNKDMVEGLMSSGRRRPLRRRRPPVHRRPRRRDDRLGRGERIPGRGRGAARRTRGDPGGRGDRRGRREVRAAAEGVRRPARGRQLSRGRGQGLRQGQPRELQGAARGRVPRRAAAQPDRQGPQARARGARPDAKSDSDAGAGDPRASRSSRVWRSRKPSIRRQASSHASA